MSIDNSSEKHIEYGESLDEVYFSDLKVGDILVLETEIFKIEWYTEYQFEITSIEDGEYRYEVIWNDWPRIHSAFNKIKKWKVLYSSDKWEWTEGNYSTITNISLKERRDFKYGVPLSRLHYDELNKWDTIKLETLNSNYSITVTDKTCDEISIKILDDDWQSRAHWVTGILQGDLLNIWERLLCTHIDNNGDEQLWSFTKTESIQVEEYLSEEVVTAGFSFTGLVQSIVSYVNFRPDSNWNSTNVSEWITDLILLSKMEWIPGINSYEDMKKKIYWLATETFNHCGLSRYSQQQLLEMLEECKAEEIDIKQYSYNASVLVGLFKQQSSNK